MTISPDRDRLVETMEAQASIGATDGGGLHRLALSEEDERVRDWFSAQMDAAGLSTRIDEFGNMFGRREGTDPAAAPVLLGSHLDSQPSGGIYDGALGVVAALEFVRTLDDEGIETERPIEIVNWTNEEGSRFQPAMQGSGVWAGAHDKEEEYATTDEDGVSLKTALEGIGYLGDAPAEPLEEYDSYLELHVEQGPYLEDGGHQVGVVTGIVGFVWGAITFSGEPNHSGSTPMAHRSDALVGAADVITQVRRIPSTLGPRTVGTTGYVSASPNSINIIPGDVTFTFGFRDPDDEVVDEAFDRVLLEADAAADREGLDWRFEERMRVSSVEFADRCVDAVESAATSLEYDRTRIFSGAGHDASHASRVCDTGMVFAVSENGKSHTEAEYTSWDDCYAAANTLANAALELARPTDTADS
ncbi:Zn-dependent hydrolase [Natrarchaeobius halalkaliphilus]|uniref:Zn-dependent hydrolase n=1 Tax=Natrarchaeobius halalkaliphilus TaxID=1679091 RepID=A0A3N6LJI7_9EURY|nr:Zn-dependent hydrolase [Natrarchaeobius halalkaliphilus]RQG88863.1 Zn-dependent hydrolase [Natrarchaeobius halalkaliphilus]